jgi:putative methyltransferase (TIGR04325 family)
MSFAAFARRLLPPIVLDALRPLHSLGRRPAWEMLPGGFASLPASARGWSDESILAAQRERWPAFVAALAGPGPLGVAHESPAIGREDLAAHHTVMAFAYVLARAARGRDRLSLLDWGGGIGHYAALARVLMPEVELEYDCRDLPLLCRHGRTLFPNATFHEDDGCLDRTYDLVLASSSLQYREDWRGTLAGLARATGGWLFVTRLPVVRRVPSFVVVQRPSAHGYHTEYAGWFLNRGELLDEGARLGLALEREILIDERAVVAGAPEACEYRGFLFRPAPRS